MHYLKRFFKFYINSSIHVAIAVIALVEITALEFNFESDKTLMAFIFFSSITAYNFVKYFETTRLHRKSLSGDLRWILFFSVLMSMPLLYLTFLIEFRVLLWLIVLGLLTVLYALPLFPINLKIKDEKGLRAVSGIKIYIIAFVWSAVTVIVPIINENFNLNWDIVITTIQRFLLVLVLMLPFEIRDLQFDSLNLETIPQKIGVKSTKLIGVLLIIGFILLEFFKDNLKATWIVANLILMIILMLALLFSKKEQNKYYAAFWVEAIPLFWLVILLMLG